MAAGAGLALAGPRLALAQPAPPPAPGPTPTPQAGPAAAPGPTPIPSPQAGPAAATPGPTPEPAAGPQWLQALVPLALWSGPDEGAVRLGIAGQFDYFQLAKPQEGPRLLVLVARSKNYAWLDAVLVGPSGPPPSDWPPPDNVPPADLSIGWVAATADAPLFADVDGTVLLGLVPAGAPLKQLEPQQGSVLLVQDPYTEARSYVEALRVGPIEAPARVEVPGRWWGSVAAEGVNLRPGPTTRSEPLVQLAAGTPVVVQAWVEGEEVIPDNPTWAQLAEGVYLYSSVVRPTGLPVAPLLPGPPLVGDGKWIDLNLTHQVVVAYEGATPTYMARTSTGRPGWETPPGEFEIFYRVENETMDSTTLLGMDAERADYKVENVRWTQYFTRDGRALHENYWKATDEFGIPSSHGCAGVVAADALFFWNWAQLGTPIWSHN